MSVLKMSTFYCRYDVYSGEPVVYKDVRYEQACVLFNLGGLYSQLASNEDRMSDEVRINRIRILATKVLSRKCV